MRSWLSMNQYRIKILITVFVVIGCLLLVAEPAVMFVFSLFANLVENIIAHNPIKM